MEMIMDSRRPTSKIVINFENDSILAYCKLATDTHGWTQTILSADSAEKCFMPAARHNIYYFLMEAQLF